MTTTGTALETVLRRDRLVVAGALALTIILSWAYVLWLAIRMDMPAGGMPHIAPAPWTISHIGFLAAMWVVMMIGMMTPSAAPMILLYARVGRHAAQQGHPFAATGWFAGGYLLAWTAAALLAAAAQAALEAAAMMTPMMTVANRLAGGAVLVAAGLYQWTPFKNACLEQCQAPLQFIQQHGGFRREVAGSLKLGLRHGLYCIGCCWMLMALLFVGGVMNVLVIAAITAVVLLEKIAPGGRSTARLLGSALMAAGAWLIGSAV